MSNYALAALLRGQAKERREREDEKSSMFGFLRGLDPSFDDRSKPGFGVKSDDPLYNIANIIRGMSGVQTEGEQISGLRNKVLATGDPQMALLFKAMNQKNASKDRIQALVTLAKEKRDAATAARNQEKYKKEKEQDKIDATAWSMIKNQPEDATTLQRLKVRREIVNKLPRAKEAIDFLDKWIVQSYGGDYRTYIKKIFPLDENGKVDLSGVELEDAQNALKNAQQKFPKQKHDALIKLKEAKEEEVAYTLTADLNPTSPLPDMVEKYELLREKNLVNTPTGKRLNKRIAQKGGENAERQYLERKDNVDFAKDFWSSLPLGDLHNKAVGLEVELWKSGVLPQTKDGKKREERQDVIKSAFQDSFYYIKQAISRRVGETTAFNSLFLNGPPLRTLPEKLLKLQYTNNKTGEIHGVFWEGEKIDKDMLLPMVKALVGTSDVPYFNLSQQQQEYTNGEMESLEARDERVSWGHKMLNLLANAGLLSENVKIVDREGRNVIWSPKWNDERRLARRKQMVEGGS